MLLMTHKGVRLEVGPVNELTTLGDLILLIEHATRLEAPSVLKLLMPGMRACCLSDHPGRLLSEETGG